MQDQNISPNPESQPDAQPISDAPAPAAPSPSKKKTGLFIVGSFGVLIAVILISCIATNAIDIRKIIPGFGHYDKPQLKEDQILVGFEDKYFFTGDKFADMAKTVYRTYGLYENDLGGTDNAKKVENIDALLRRKPDRTNSVYGAETFVLTENKKSDGYRKRAILLTSSSDPESIFYQTVTFGDQDFSLVLNCANSKEIEFEVEDEIFKCGITTKEEVEKFLEDLGDAVETDEYNNHRYKNHEISFTFTNNKEKTLSTIVFHSIQKEEKETQDKNDTVKDNK